ncbi:unnamed protein product [Clavelina lepadiformis]|uniref:SUN domain-containing protein n=1 Tax=Clavelina lepadiformis TaxID=159417 RepID=A0ABP0FYT6_CLALP
MSQHIGPIRQSERLHASGYYRHLGENGETTNVLDSATSDNDDTVSIDSNLSRVSRNSERQKSYRETGGNTSFRRRRKHSGSPFKVQSVLQQSDEHRSNVFKKLQFTKKQSVLAYSTNYSKSETSPSIPFLTQTVASGQKQKILHTYGMDNGEYSTSNQLQEKASFESNRYTKGDECSQAPFKQNLDLHKRHIKHKHVEAGDVGIKTSLEERKRFGSDESELFSDDELKSELKPNIRVRGSSKDTSSHGLLGNSIFFLFHMMQTLFAVAAKPVWFIGKHFYQNIARVLLFDIWAMRVKVDGKYFLLQGTRLLRLLLYTMALISIAFVCYSTVTTFDVFPYLQTPRPEHSQSETNVNGMYKLFKELEFSMRQQELKYADLYASTSGKVAVLESNFQKDKQKYVEDYQEVIAAIDNTIEKSLSQKLTTSYATLESKLKDLQVEIARIEEYQSRDSKQLESLKLTLEQIDNTVKKDISNQLSKMSGFEENIASLDKKVDEIHQEYRNLKLSIDTYSGNTTYVQNLVNDQFVENFLLLLQKGTTANLPSQDISKSRYHHLALVFLEWLQKRGFVQNMEVQQLLQQVNTNLTQASIDMKANLQRVQETLQKEYNSKRSSVTLDTIVSHERESHSSKLTEVLVKQWIVQALDSYNADKVGKPDFALETSGGAIVNTRCSDTYQHRTAVVSILGIPIYYNVNTPRSVIQPGVMPGECWAFKGSQGYIVISLSESIYPSSFTLEHISKSIALHNNISSAPKDFAVFGLEDASSYEGELLGTYRYERDGSPIQEFTANKKLQEKGHYKFVELRISSNWGNPHFTCVYRFRVHGTATV